VALLPLFRLNLGLSDCGSDAQKLPSRTVNKGSSLCENALLDRGIR
jgi:hypothetical protein